ncbi:MAG: hypothetical protein ACTHKC_10555 [Candidatus Nitrosocosmicus sp.]
MSTTKSNLFIIASLTLISVLMISSPFIYKGIFVKKNNSFLFQQVFAQANATNTNTNNNSSSLSKTTTNNNQTDTEQTIVRQGIVTSSQARHNETAQVAVILPHRDDGKSYSGVLTFSASQPVGIGLLQKLPMDNKTISNIDFKKYGGSVPLWIRDIIPHHKLNQTGLQIIAGITPNYGTSTPFYSASIPFVASGVALWSQSGTPFLVSYQVFAKLIQPEIVNSIEGKNIK